MCQPDKRMVSNKDLCWGAPPFTKPQNFVLLSYIFRSLSIGVKTAKYVIFYTIANVENYRNAVNCKRDTSFFIIDICRIRLEGGSIDARGGRRSITCKLRCVVCPGSHPFYSLPLKNLSRAGSQTGESHDVPRIRSRRCPVLRPPCRRVRGPVLRDRPQPNAVRSTNRTP